MKNEIYIFSPPEVFGGAEVYQIRLADLMCMGHLFTVVSPRSPGLQRGIAKAGGTFIELNSGGSIKIRVAFLIWLWGNRKLLEDRASAIVLNGRGAAYFAPVVKIVCGVAPVVICHTELPRNSSDIKVWLFGFALRYARLIVAVSETVATQHRERWPTLVVTAIPNWLDAASYPKRQNPPGIDALEADIAVVGRLAENKGIFDVISVITENVSPTVHFYGEGPLKVKLEEIAGRTSGLKVHGHVENLWQQLSRHAILLSASYSESFSYSVAEGIYSGLLCVISDIPAHRELLGPQYPDALYFVAGDRAGLRDSLVAARGYLSRTDGIASEIIGAAKTRIDNRNDPELARREYRAALLDSN